MRTIYVGGAHEVRCDGESHWVYPEDAPRWRQGDCDCGRQVFGTIMHVEPDIEEDEELCDCPPTHCPHGLPTDQYCQRCQVAFLRGRV